MREWQTLLAVLLAMASLFVAACEPHHHPGDDDQSPADDDVSPSDDDQSPDDDDDSSLDDDNDATGDDNDDNDAADDDDDDNDSSPDDDNDTTGDDDDDNDNDDDNDTTGDDDDDNDDDNDTTSIVWVPVPGGTVYMGCIPGDANRRADENPRHVVTVTAFEITQTDITQGQFWSVIGNNPSGFLSCGCDCPVETVKWSDALDFCESIGGRLVTEAEWEYAARAWTNEIYYCGNDPSCLDAIAWYSANSGGATHPVCGKQPNAWGLCDMLGNVDHWVNDWYDASYYQNSPQNDPQGPSSGTDRVVRGGSFGDDATTLRISARGWIAPDSAVDAVGFRCARGGVDDDDDSTPHWSSMPFPAGDCFYSVWGTSSSDVFTVDASGVILHYDGSSWSLMPYSDASGAWLNGVWGSSSSDVFAVGGAPTLHYDGSSWSPTGPEDWFRSVWGSSSSDVYSVGNSIIAHYDGSTWSTLTDGVVATVQLLSVWGSSSSDVLATGWDSGANVPAILHYDGSSWSAMPNVTLGCYYLWGNSSSDVFGVSGDATSSAILHYDGSSWSPMISGITELLRAVWGSSSADVFAVGDGGTILHYDGSTWSPMANPSLYVLYGVWGTSSLDVFVVGGEAILHYGY